tara:strand:+ start:414 stop:662 length:249 start_codon:yes stop_codon:yes gene_type:complete
MAADQIAHVLVVFDQQDARLHGSGERTTEKKKSAGLSGTTLNGFSQAFVVSADFTLWNDFSQNPQNRLRCNRSSELNSFGWF